jgi:PilZ domain
MTLSSMVVSRDWQEISVLECILGGLRIGVEVETEPERARAKLDKSKIDALIVDCDLTGSSAFLRGVQQENHQSSVPLLIVSGSSGRGGLEAMGASFVFEKPISVEQAVHTLSAARNMILDGRLRYHRETLDLPVWLTGARKKRAKAHLMNLSQGGMGIHTRQPLPMSAPLQISFALPGTKRVFKIQGEVVWMNPNGQAGIRFAEGKPRTKRQLQLWLERQYFTH